MTDLPRFTEGNIGRLDFTHLNEMMRRLDLLRPVVENASLLSGAKAEDIQEPFLVYAESNAELGFPGRYKWTEIWQDEQLGIMPRPKETLPSDDYESPTPRTGRTGGIVDVDEGTLTGDYGSFLPDFEGTPGENPGDEPNALPAYCICYPIRNYNRPFAPGLNVVPPLDVTYYLIPVRNIFEGSSGGTDASLFTGIPVMFRISGVEGPTTLPSVGGDIDAMEYRGQALNWVPWRNRFEGALGGRLFDMSYGNGVMYENWPSADLDTSPSYKELASGTVVQAWRSYRNENLCPFWDGCDYCFMAPPQAPVDFTCP